MAALGTARFVGGAVRNALLNRPVSDIDIAVPIPPEETLARLTAANIKAIPTGIDHGTITAVIGECVFEVTSLRRDIETDGRHAVVRFTDDWTEDAGRRDFTMNALYAGADGAIFDYVGGVPDLMAGRVRFVGDADARIAEDYLRILRLFRFHAWYGKGEIENTALRAAARAKQGLAQLSGERIAKELLRLLECPGPAPVLRAMAAAGILTELLPFALDLPRLEHLVLIDADSMFSPDAILRLAALLPSDGAAADAVGEKLKLSGVMRARLQSLAAANPVTPQMSAPAVRALLYRMGADAVRDHVLLAWAGAPRTAGAIGWRMLLSVAANWQRPRFPLTGRDVMAAGVAEGPAVGKALAAVEDWWIAGDFTADDAALRERLRTELKAAR
jgi:poly(A) polymerase